MSERERLLALEGALNWRDLGGYPTADGRVTKWDRIYRSDGLDQLTDTDLDGLRPGLLLEAEIVGARDYDLVVRPRLRAVEV